MNILLTIAYDGTNYCGWQRQLNGITVQEAVESSLSQAYKHAIVIQGASRTDSGVHARGQRAVFSLTENDINIPTEKIPFAVNQNLPDDVRVIRAEEVSPSFHPIYSAKKKTYEYCLYNNVFHDPLLRLYTENIYLPLEIGKMQTAAEYFFGEHDFKAFCAAGGNAKTSIRTIYSIEILKQNDLVTLRITGNGFLYNMVRIIAGTLVYVGLGKIDPHHIPEIIRSRDRTKAGKTLSAKGLSLVEIFY